MKRTIPPKKQKAKTGPKVYQPWMAEKAKMLVGILGARNQELAMFFDVHITTIESWIQKNPEFSYAVKQGRLEKMMKAANGLYQRAIGYSCPDVHIMPQTIKEYDENGRVISTRTAPLITEIVKHYPPDPYAANKFLTVMFREVWAETTNHNVNLNADINYTKVEELKIEDLPDEVKNVLFQLNFKQLAAPQQN